MGKLMVKGLDGELLGYGVTWTKDNAADMAAAKKVFTEYVNKGWLAIGEVSGDTRLMFIFDPDADIVTLAPPVIGG